MGFKGLCDGGVVVRRGGGYGGEGLPVFKLLTVGISDGIVLLTIPGP